MGLPLSHGLIGRRRRPERSLRSTTAGASTSATGGTSNDEANQPTRIALRLTQTAHDT